MLVHAILSGLVFGLYFTLVGLGLNLVFGVMRIVNLAHGDVLMLGAFAAVSLFGTTGASPLLSAALVPFVFFLLGLPFYYLVVPRLLACALLVPLLTIMADFMGIMGGALICTHVFGVEPHYYWQHSENYVTMWDVGMGLVKAIFFGTSIALISCHGGLNSQAGAEGVGRAATEAFVSSFVAILVLDFFLAIVLLNLYDAFVLGGEGRSLL